MTRVAPFVAKMALYEQMGASRTKEQEALLSALDPSSTEELDPSLTDGYYVYYEREVPFELRMSEATEVPQEVGALEAIRVKLLVRGEQDRPDAVTVYTRQFVFRARHVLLCTNAFTTGAAGRLGRTTVPLRVYQIATAPLDADTVARIAPDRRPIGDTRKNLFTYRLDRDNRLISGGMAAVPLGDQRRSSRIAV